MLQILLDKHPSYSIPEQAQMAIEAGCTWLILGVNAWEEPNAREIIGELTSLCQETGTILTFENRAEFAKEFKVHGIITTSGNSPVQYRLELGAEAIIGAESQNVEEIISFDKADIDYIGLKSNNLSPVIAAVRTNGSAIPFVFIGNIEIEQIKELLFCGYNGICLYNSIFSALDPVEEIRKYIEALTEYAN